MSNHLNFFLHEILPKEIKCEFSSIFFFLLKITIEIILFKWHNLCLQHKSISKKIENILKIKHQHQFTDKFSFI